MKSWKKQESPHAWPQEAYRSQHSSTHSPVGGVGAAYLLSWLGITFCPGGTPCPGWVLGIPLSWLGVPPLLAGRCGDIPVLAGGGSRLGLPSGRTCDRTLDRTSDRTLHGTDEEPEARGTRRKDQGPEVRGYLPCGRIDKCENITSNRTSYAGCN